MNSKKPKKRVMLYWFIEKGFFYIVASLFIIGTVLRYVTYYPTLTLFILNLSIWVLILSSILIIYEWVMTEYFLLKKHLFIKKGKTAIIVPYNNIKKVGYYGNLLQHLMGTTNIRIQTKDKKSYYLEGIKNYKKIENEILKRMK